MLVRTYEGVQPEILSSSQIAEWPRRGRRPRPRSRRRRGRRATIRCKGSASEPRDPDSWHTSRHVPPALPADRAGCARRRRARDARLHQRGHRRGASGRGRRRDRPALRRRGRDRGLPLAPGRSVGRRGWRRCRIAGGRRRRVWFAASAAAASIPARRLPDDPTSRPLPTDGRRARGARPALPQRLAVLRARRRCQRAVRAAVFVRIVRRGPGLHLRPMLQRYGLSGGRGLPVRSRGRQHVPAEQLSRRLGLRVRLLLAGPRAADLVFSRLRQRRQRVRLPHEGRRVHEQRGLRRWRHRRGLRLATDGRVLGVRLGGVCRLKRVSFQPTMSRKTRRSVPPKPGVRSPSSGPPKVPAA